jgi:hypothetical protein
MRAEDFSSVVLCEDVRHEVTDKLIMIGVFSGDIIVPAFPVTIQLSAWAELRSAPIGTTVVNLRIGLTDKPWVIASITLENQVDARPISFVVPPLQVFIEKDCEFILQVQNGEEYEDLRRKKIYLGAVPQAFTVSNVAQPPSSQSPPDAPAS